MKWMLLMKEYSAENGPEPLIEKARKGFGEYGVYPGSIQTAGDTLFFLARQNGEKALALYGSREYFERFEGSETVCEGAETKLCPLNHHNCVQMRELFGWAKPCRSTKALSMGFGDRLGRASAGHVRAIANVDVFPILAQQSIRELNLTGRTFESVLDDACWAVFQEGYKGGFGADADHLKLREHVEGALNEGYTMITLDCSDHIRAEYAGMELSGVEERYAALPEAVRGAYEARYLNEAHAACGEKIAFTPEALMRYVLIYSDALDFIELIDSDVLKKSSRGVDFEVSIDETTFTTDPAAHYLIANEMRLRGVEAVSVAPRFCGEFQKGIDYIGELAQFEKEIEQHAKIARHFGYKLSIHSGSDKFSAFPGIGKATGLKAHVKTAGTSWLEAVRLVAMKNPALYRRMHAYALETLNRAKQYYHIGAKRSA